MTVTQDRNATGSAAPSPAPPAGSRSDGGGRLATLDGLRLIAALMVAMFHYTAYNSGVKASWGAEPAQAFPGLYQLTSFGWMGVELFFMISGFVICMSSWGRTAGGFFRSRITRLFPAYWPAVLITTAVLTIWPTVREPVRLSHLLVNLSMLNEPLGVRSVDGVYWTLWAEGRFYLLFAVALLWRGGGLTLRRVLIFGYAWTIGSVLAVSSKEPLLKVVLQPEYSALFIAGVAYYLIYRFGSDVRLWGLIGVSFMLAAHNVVLRVAKKSEGSLDRHLSPAVGVLLLAGFFAVLAVIALGWTSRIRWRWLTTAGLLTYPFYLLHENIGWTVIHGMRGLRPRYLALAVVLAAMLLAAWLLHKLIEKPVARWLKGKLEAASTAGRGAAEARRDKYATPNQPVRIHRQPTAYYSTADYPAISYPPPDYPPAGRSRQ